MQTHYNYQMNIHDFRVIRANPMTVSNTTDFVFITDADALRVQKNPEYGKIVLVQSSKDTSSRALDISNGIRVPEFTYPKNEFTAAVVNPVFVSNTKGGSCEDRNAENKTEQYVPDSVKESSVQPKRRVAKSDLSALREKATETQE